MDVPERLRGAPAMLLAHAATLVDGDWRRVVWANNELTIHNKPQKFVTELPPVKAPKKRAPRVKKPVITAPLPAAVKQPAVAAPMVPQQKTVVVQDRRTELEREATAHLRTPRFDQALPPEFSLTKAWEDMDVEVAATAILNRCRKGLPDILPLDLHPDVLALEGINLDIVRSSVRNPTYVEIAGRDTKEKGYPVLRFTRGDVMTVVGLRELRFPIVIATYATSRLDPDLHRPGTMKGTAGGGGARRQQGLPKTPKAVMTRLRAAGADVLLDNALSDAPVVVTFRGQELGKVSVKAPASQCESDYQRMMRKMEAISRR